jgi:hypothetical protein
MRGVLVNDVFFPTFRREDPLTQTDWNQRISKLDGNGFFYTAEWSAVLQKTYGFCPIYFTKTTGSRLTSVLPMMEVNSRFTGKRGVSLPFTDQCEALGASESENKSLFKEALNHGKEQGWKYIESRGGTGLAGLFEKARPSLAFYSHELDLLADENQLFSKLDDSVRRAIRKAQKSGLTLEVSTSQPAIRDYYRLHCETRREHGLPPQSLLFFLNIHKYVLTKNMGMVISAKHESRTIASAVFFIFGTRAIYKFGASDRQFLSLRANNFVMWEAIKWCKQRGAHQLNFGRTSLTNEGLRRYKLGWGTQENQVAYHKYDLRTGEFRVDHDDTSGWHTRVFQNVPIFLSRLAGAILYKHMA